MAIWRLSWTRMARFYVRKYSYLVFYKILARENFNGEVKLVELLVYFNLMNCHYRFLDEDITFNSFQQLRQDDLERMGFRLGTIRSILAAIYGKKIGLPQKSNDKI